MGRSIGRFAVLAALVAAAGCTSSTAGKGTGQFTGVATVSDQPTDSATDSPSTTPSDPQTGGGGGGGGGGNGGGGGGHSSGTSTPPRSAGVDPDASPAMISFQAVAGPSCTGSSGASTVTMAWQSTGADQVWIEVLPVAVEASNDPKNADGAVGPLPANGSRSFPFECGNPANYYNIGIYNSKNGRHTGEDLQVPRNS